MDNIEVVADAVEEKRLYAEQDNVEFDDFTEWMEYDNPQETIWA